VLKWIPSGRRKRGSPRIRLIKEVCDEVAEKGLENTVDIQKMVIGS
jgi:hypothetical protein